MGNLNWLLTSVIEVGYHDLTCKWCGRTYDWGGTLIGNLSPFGDIGNWHKKYCSQKCYRAAEGGGGGAGAGAIAGGAAGLIGRIFAGKSAEEKAAKTQKEAAKAEERAARIASNDAEKERFAQRADDAISSVENFEFPSPDNETEYTKSFIRLFEQYKAIGSTYGNKSNKAECKRVKGVYDALIVPELTGLQLSKPELFEKLQEQYKKAKKTLFFRMHKTGIWITIFFAVSLIGLGVLGIMQHFGLV